MAQASRKDQILEFIRKNPGHHFRGIQRSLRLSTGVLQHHLGALIKEADVIVRDINGTSCYFPSKTFREEQFLVLSHLRNRVRNRVLRVLLDGRSRSPLELRKEVSISAATLSYHLSLMASEGILEKVLDEGGTKYRLKDLGLFKGLIVEYKESFADKLIQDFISLWSR